MKRLLPFVFIFFIYLIYGIFITQFDLRIIPIELVSENPQGFHDYKGIVNVHTSLSSGSGNLPQIIESGKNADLDFMIITDLNLYEKPQDWAGYHENLLVFIDGEYSYLNSRLLNIDTGPSNSLEGLGRSQVLIADRLSQKSRHRDQGIFVLTHPLKNKYRWTGEYPAGLDGLEVINLKDMWQSAWVEHKTSFFWSLLIYPFNDRLALLRLFKDPKEELALWDKLTKSRKIIGLAGADAEAKVQVTKDKFLSFPSYQTLFGLIRNHVLLRSELTGQASSDKIKIGNALREGQFYMSLDILADPKGFNALLKSKDGHTYTMGSNVPWSKDLNLQVTLPHKPRVPLDIIVLKDGQRYLTSNSQTSNFKITEPGVYRVNVRVIPTFPLPDGKKWVPWIYSNPFYIQ